MKSEERVVDPRFPIGKFQRPSSYNDSGRRRDIEVIEKLPGALRAAVKGLSDEQLETPYREGGWTVRQVIHHYADSHMNALIRFKLALTEEEPIVKTYDEKLWADLPDVAATPVEVSLSLVEGIHARWVALLRAMSETDFARAFKHPEHGVITLDFTLALYTWHCHHHVAHITELKKLRGWR